MSGTLLTCTVCGDQNTFPIANINMQKRESLTTLCSTCGSVTLQKISSLPNHGNQHTGSANISLASTQNGMDAYHQTPVLYSDEHLWIRLQEALVNNGVSIPEFFRCDTPTKGRIISALGFSTVESPRLLELSKTSNPQQILKSAGGQDTEPVVSGTAVSVQSVSPESVLTAAKLKSSPLPECPTNSTCNAAEVMKTPQSDMRTKKPLPGLIAQEDGALVARCSVYPHLPADFWCSLCGVLVSSRCHVSGIHKDHPFITLRQAAEAHVRDLYAWADRCRCQLNVAGSIVANLQHGKEIIRGSIRTQEEVLDQHFNDIVYGLTKWRDELKSSMRLQADAELKNIDLALEKTNTLIGYYGERQRSCEPLLHSIPPVHQVNSQSEDWSLRVMNLVNQLKMTSYDPIPMPRLTVPEVKTSATTATYMDLLKAVSVPAGVPVPDVLDTGYLNFPHPSEVGRESFMLHVPSDAKARGVLIYSGRTLTRSQGVTPAHVLVCATQVFYTGITAWEVHVDRLGAGPGRILAGVLMAGTDGEGVVWDGQRIVGPNEGECRVLPDRYRLRTGTKLRFVLELDAPSYFFICYYEDEVVARVPLPPALNGWIPSFSVFGPQDQLTVVPSSKKAADFLLANAVLEGKKVGTATNRNETKKWGEKIEEEEQEREVRLVEQEQKLNALQQQLLAVNSRIDQEQYEKQFNQARQWREAKNGGKNDKNATRDLHTTPLQQKIMFSPSKGEDFTIRQVFDHSPNNAKEMQQQQQQSPSSWVTGEAGGNDARNEGYSDELQNLLNFVGSIR